MDSSPKVVSSQRATV